MTDVKPGLPLNGPFARGVVEKGGRMVLSRREFLELSAMASAAALAGCATNPVTGTKEIMLYSRRDEIAMDQQAAPHQFSADYGALQDVTTNNYLAEVGRQIAAVSHRPDMPYSFRGVNASYVNAYAFPGGSIAATRGILLTLDNEAELAALLGHEIGHVSARHTAHAMSKGALVSGGLTLAALLVGASDKHKDYAPWVIGLGSIGAGMLLARYSREDERQADELGLQYMVCAGHNPQGMVGLMDKLRKMEKDRPGVIELMFATHPMSAERYRMALERVQSQYAVECSRPLNRERYQDTLAALRRLRPTVAAVQRGDEYARGQRWDAAWAEYQEALRLTPDDYEGLLKAAVCQLRKHKAAEAFSLAQKAAAVYPAEPQAWHVSGLAALMQRRYEEALSEFTRYERVLPGNPLTTFYRARAYDGLGQREPAAELYMAFLRAQSEGQEAEFARQRLAALGYRAAP